MLACDVSTGRGWATACLCGTRRPRPGEVFRGRLRTAAWDLSRGLGLGLDWEEEAEGPAFRSSGAASRRLTLAVGGLGLAEIVGV